MNWGKEWVLVGCVDAWVPAYAGMTERGAGMTEGAQE